MLKALLKNHCRVSTWFSKKINLFLGLLPFPLSEMHGCLSPASVSGPGPGQGKIYLVRGPHGNITSEEVVYFALEI